ncbi:hypothetical protein HS1_002328 [Candidatus Desulfofervidus auxilii]|uniref:Uncharacterized protein n=1 Tax=Desulfofervidus auxilii TaxID=1621989 RepID=A0A7V1I459_DESA2|nr:hypothetical protein [Candidatus Desulfofervidus auxilii]CAD7781068.1 hypothetical protein BLFGPEAP_02702 [Candidatus Methanoperedenaceae archaeon GB50]CAD7782004.1 hypothetical protein DMNBHIDG_02886 [Candidatus Methanoperedenaceae archaeon GB37]AMM42110.1 hypothetical protein HS1_002328 [Candidatus Desulfofervidus auxilii]MDL1966530.1 hypothetical protein [Candidatus Desulfofervidus auxilii]CAD7782873.1 MAG: hypothetical protein KIIPBIDF_01829 [Candidatus Methanoperedenaceae archaeon GB50
MGKLKEFREKIDNLFMAITYAEAGCVDMARELLKKEQKSIYKRLIPHPVSQKKLLFESAKRKVKR